MKASLGVAILTTCLVSCKSTASTALSQRPTASPFPIYKVDDLRKPGQPHLTRQQITWISRIRRTPFFAHRLSLLRYIVNDQSEKSPDPPLVVFVENGPESGQGTVIVDHKSGLEPCNPFYFDNRVVADTPGCTARLPSPVH